MLAVSGYTAQPDEAGRPAIRALIARHHKLMRDTSPPESCHAMDASELCAEEIMFYSVTDGDAVLGIGALKELEPGHGEIKSMHVAREARGRGVSKALLAALLDAAASRSITRVSLETGVEDVFIAARKLYEANGFHVCPPFADYTDDPLSVFMTKVL